MLEPRKRVCQPSVESPDFIVGQDNEISEKTATLNPSRRVSHTRVQTHKRVNSSENHLPELLQARGSEHPVVAA